MTWKTRRTSKEVCVDVDLSDFTDEQLLQGLIDSGRITPQMASAIMSDEAKEETKNERDPYEMGELYHARLAIARGDKTEAMHYIESYLGRDWYGVLQ